MTSNQPIVPLSEYHRLPQESLPADFYRRQFEVICNNATVALLIMDEQQRCVYMNPAAEMMSGYSLAEVKGRLAHDVLHHTRPDGSHYPLCECPIDQAFPQNNQEKGEEVFVHKDGSFYPVAFTASPIREGERTTGTIVEIRDISQWKEAEVALQQANDALKQQAQQLEQTNASLQSTLEQLHAAQEELRKQNQELAIAREIAEAERQRYQDLFDFAPDAYVVTNADGIIQEVNQVLAALVEVNRENLIQTPLVNYIAASEHEGFKNLLKELRQQPGLQKLQTDELSLQLADQSSLSVAITGRANRNSQGHILEIRWLIQDITKRKQAELALLDKERQLQQLSDSMPQFVWMSKATGELEYVNRQWSEYSGLTLEESRDQTRMAALHHPDDLQFVFEQWATCLKSQQPFEGEARLKRADGAYRWFLIRTVPSFDEQGQLIRWYGTSTDIHERKLAQLNEQFLSQLELQLQNHTDADTMVSDVIHSLGTYLTVDRCVWHNIDEAAGLAIVKQEWHRQELPSVVGVHRLSDFILPDLLDLFHLGQPAVTADVTQYRYSAPFAENYASLGVRAFVGVPCLAEGQVVALLIVFSTTTRDWRSDEIELLQETASRLWSRIEQTRAIQALRESENRLQMALEGSGGGLWDWNIATDETYRSQRWLEMLGYEEGDLPEDSSTWAQLIHPDDRAWVFKQAQAHFQDDSVPYKFEYRLLSKSGEWKWIASYGKVVMRDEQGTPIRMAGIHHDINDRKQVEAALKESERRFRRLVESNMFGVVFGDFAGGIHYTNDYFLKMVGYTREEIATGLIQWTEITPPEFLHLDEKAISELRKTGVSTPFEKEFIRKDGSRVPILIGSALLDEPYDQQQEIIAFLLDLTERKRVEAERDQFLQKEQAAREAAEHANRTKDEFLAVLSHELRSPLNPILGWAKLLRSGQLNEQRTQHALEVIERNAQVQAQLINDLLDVSRILQGKLSLNPNAVDLNLTIQAAIETVRLAAEAKAIQIQTLLEPNVGQIWGDAGRLQQIVWNLLSNAVKFTPQGGEIEIRLEQRHSLAQIQISDTGKGILPSFLPYVFDHFRQEDAATTRRFGGLGLGLAIVRYLTELHGGTVQAESPGENQGATFTVKLPLMRQESFSYPSNSLSELSVSLQGIRVLVVDDDESNRDLISFLLELKKATVTTAASATEAIAKLSQFKPDVLISDIGMPEMDGYMLMRQVRALPAERGGRVAAIALTAYAGEIDYQQALSAGFQKHLSKPVDTKTLIEAISELVGQTNRSEMF